MIKITREQAAELDRIYESDWYGTRWTAINDVLNCLGIKYKHRISESGLIIDERHIIEVEKNDFVCFWCHENNAKTQRTS
jgi:hypothetical protein